MTQKNLKSISDLKKLYRNIENIDLIFDFCKQQQEKFKDFNIVLESIDIEKEKQIAKENYKNKTERDLEGIIIGIKDNFWVKGTKTTCSSKMLYNYESPKDATVVSRLKDKGAVISSKLNLDEFAMGSYGIKGYFGPTINPWSIKHNKNYVPGGSSGGSGAAVASSFVCAALGSDTGGSVRLPAAFCGLVGLKPTYGACSRYGLIAYESSLDTVGIIAPSIENCETVWNVIKGKDKNDSTTIEHPVIEPMKELKTIKVGVLKNLNQGTKCVTDSFEKVLDFFKENNISVEYIDVPHVESILQTYYVIACIGAMSKLSNFDGIRYGFNKDDLFKDPIIEQELKDLKGDQLLSKYYTLIRQHGFSSEVKRRILAGVWFSLQKGGKENLFIKKAQFLRNEYKKFFNEVFQKFDFLVCTTNYSEAISFDMVDKQSSTEEFYSDIKTVILNLIGYPGLSVPINICSEHNLPAGSVQIIGKPFHESNIFKLGKLMEDAFACGSLF